MKFFKWRDARTLDWLEGPCWHDAPDNLGVFAIPVFVNDDVDIKNCDGFLLHHFLVEVPYELRDVLSEIRPAVEALTDPAQTFCRVQVTPYGCFAKNPEPKEAHTQQLVLDRAPILTVKVDEEKRTTTYETHEECNCGGPVGHVVKGAFCRR